MTVHRIVSFISVLLLSISCNSSADPVEMKSLNGIWPKNAEQKFSFKVTDAQNPKNIIFVVRNNNDYPYSNIRFIVDLGEAKKALKRRDTLNYVLAEPNGTWLGKGFGDTKEILFQYKINYKFPKNGHYELGIVHAMRTDSLKGIEDIGVKIETPKP